MPIVILGFLPDGRSVSLEGKILPKKKEKDYIQTTIWNFLPVVMDINSYVVASTEKAEAPKNPNKPRRKPYTPMTIWDFLGN